jgi:hypothetical protein
MNRREFIRSAVSGLFIAKASPLIFDMGANRRRFSALDVPHSWIEYEPILIGTGHVYSPSVYRIIGSCVETKIITIARA